MFSLVRFGQPESVQAVGSMKSTTYARTKGNVYFVWYRSRAFESLMPRQWLLSIFQSFKSLLVSDWSDWIFSSQAFPDLEESHPLIGCSNCWDGDLLKTSWLSKFKTIIWTLPIARGLNRVWLAGWFNTSCRRIRLSGLKCKKYFWINIISFVF